MWYGLKTLGVLTPTIQIVIVAALFAWTTLWQYGEYKKTVKMHEYFPARISILFAPLYEEFIFRGLILFYLLTIDSTVTAIMTISSLLFGLWHLKNIFWLPKRKLIGQIVYTAIIFGPVASIITLWSGTIWLAVMLHYLNNLSPQFEKIIKKS